MFKQFIQTFIFAHQQEIVLDYIESRKFEFLPNVTFIFLGYNPSDRIINLSNVVIANKLEFNREVDTKLVSYTGWYVIVKNNLLHSDTEYVNLFEYDINLSINFDEVLGNELRNRPDGVLYTFWPIKDNKYFLMKEWTEKLDIVIRKLYNIDIYNHFINCEGIYWTNSTNVTLSVSVLIDYIDWFEKFYNEIKNSKFPGHEYERTISIFLQFNKKKLIHLKGLMSHIMVNSHGMTHIGIIRQYEDVKNKLINNTHHGHQTRFRNR